MTPETDIICVLNKAKQYGFASDDDVEVYESMCIDVKNNIFMIEYRAVTDLMLCIKSIFDNGCEVLFTESAMIEMSPNGILTWKSIISMPDTKFMSIITSDEKAIFNALGLF
jgi:hypothetical protein